jgi:glutamine amidotransferase
MSACVIKEPRPSTEGSAVQSLKSSHIVPRRIVINHVRRTSRGDVAYRNTHPFVREFFGREWVFAHNGNVFSRYGLSKVL